MSEKKKIQKSDWVANFTIIGRPVINDYTFKMDEKSEKSKWIYNAMNLGVDCSDRHGTVYCEMMGGYSEENENRIYVNPKKEDGSTDFENQMVVDWNDRFNDEVLEDISDMSFLTVGLEKTNADKTYYKKFLSAYDAIAYIKDHLREDMTICVRGNLKYSEYNGNVQVRKNITSIALSKAEDSSKYKAAFTQTILLDKDSASLKNIDKDKGVMFVDARVLDYVKEVNGIEVKGQYPYKKQFEFAMDFSNEAACKKIQDKLFKVKKGVSQATFEGDFVEGGAVVTATWDDLPDDIKDLVEMGVYEKEEALAKCTANGSRERRMVLKKPYIKLVGEEKTPVIQVFHERYTEDDLYLDYLYKNNDSSDDKPPFDTEEESDSDDSMSWLNAL